jgi:hypothetical protein
MSGMMGLIWAYQQTTLSASRAQYPGLVDNVFTGSQSWNDLWLAAMDPQCTMLFVDDTFPGSPGVGVWYDPTGGGSYRLDGGQFVHLAGRPYRMDHATLRQNVDVILTGMLGEPFNPLSPVPEGEQVVGARTHLLGNHPNPFNPRTTVAFELAEAAEVQLAVYDMAGRHVRTLVAGRTLTAGRHDAVWDGRDTTGRQVAAGVYFSHLRAGDVQLTRRMTLIK